MFMEFDKETLEKWNNLTDEEKQKSIKSNEVDLAVDISIKIQSHGKIVEEHKYYQVTTFNRLIEPISISNIKERNVELLFNQESVMLNVNDEKIIEIGNVPYQTTYVILVTNVKYGQVVEL